MSEITTMSGELVVPEEKLTDLRREVENVREDYLGNKYIADSMKALQAGALRGAIGSYWNAVVDDLRRKVMYRSLDLFNKEMNPPKTIKTYEDFQDHVTEHLLIEGAFKIGVIDWEARKMLHHARETRNIFDGHPDSLDPTLAKVFNMIVDCNRYVLSQEPLPPIIDVNEYILTMDSDDYHKNAIAVEQAFSDLPEIYKNELTNKLVSYYHGDSTSMRLRSNIEFSFPLLWTVLSKETRKQIGSRLDQAYRESSTARIEAITELMCLVDGLRYVSERTRELVYEPVIVDLEEALDDWKREEKAVAFLKRLGTVVPERLIDRLVSCLTLTYVGYIGSSPYWSRTDFFSDSAAPRITEMFEKFDNQSVGAFIEVVQKNEELHSRIRNKQKLNRLRSLGRILLNIPTLREDHQPFLELLVDEERTSEFYSAIKKREKATSKSKSERK